MKIRICKVASVYFSFAILNFVYAEQYKMCDSVIKANISYQNLNRISVKGDKIDSILGIDNAFHYEKNDKTGEIFLRPTEENGYSPISLSVTTVSGKTQDLLLEPKDREANSIELLTENTQFSPLELPDECDVSNDYEESISNVMKKFINLPAHRQRIEVPGVQNRSFEHLRAKFSAAYRIDGFLCLEFIVETTVDGIFRLDERMFSRKGDIALSLSNLFLGKNSKVTLFVMRR